MKKLIAMVVIILCAVSPIIAVAQEKESHIPISIERKNIDGIEYLTKTYEVSYETQLSELKEESFETDGFLFVYETVDKDIQNNEDKKNVVEEVKIETQSGDLEEILKQLPSVKEYNKDSYIGKIVLNTGSIVTEVSGYTTKSYTVSTLKEYPGLMYSDPSYVAQTALKDGYTLPLTNIDWVVMGTGLEGDTLVPTEYKANATYSKVFSNQVPTGYISTARYEGEVSKVEADTILYTLTYKGTVIGNNAMPMPLKIISGILGVALIIGGGFILLLVLKSRKNADIYNLVDKEYICIGKQAVDVDNPIINLNEFDDMIQNNVFKMVLDKSISKKLFGRNISVTYQDVTVKHMIGERRGEYSFDLDLGGVLDAQ